ncbi:MAG: hypothetical protein IJY70_01050 [Clostridia bacterium]|nr:hypothetical protein [Clostridia bacterium]
MEYRISATDSEVQIQTFMDACAKMLEGKTLLAEKNIADILRSIADGDKLYNQFKTALRGYDYEGEFRNSQTKVGGRSKLVVPQSQVKLMAYVFCLLMEFDSGKRSLREFLDEYFYHTNPTEQYALFLNALIVPFRDVTEYIFYNGVDAYGEDEIVDGALRDSVKRLLQELNTLVSESPLITVAVKQDLFALARAIESSLTPNRIDLIKPLLIGYKNTANSYPVRDKLAPYIEKLYRVLTTAEIL